ncbi:hypothetical protein TYRP_014885 [Tyrophagus putrescentiae]|nr:hypothetical protein TYRP_014885 [Tyrophagus putrescentiae]
MHLTLLESALRRKNALQDMQLAQPKLIPLLHRVLRVEARSTEDLHRICGALVGHVGGVALGNGGPVGVRVALFVGKSRPHVAHTGRLNADDHVGEDELNRLVAGNGNAKGLPLEGVGGRLVEAPLS